MKIIYYCKKFYRLPLSFKKLLWQAVLYSLFAECNLKLRRFQLFKPHQENRPETPIHTAEQKQQVIRIARVMRTLEKKAPWKPMCFNRAITAKRLLRLQGIETTLHLGFKKGEQEEAFAGHAWLTIGNFYITGKVPDLRAYKELKPIAKKIPE